MRTTMKSRYGAFEPYLYIIPYFVVFALFLVIPGVAGMIIGLFDWPVVGSHPFIGLGNYKELFKDQSFIRAVVNTIAYTVMYVPAFILLGLLLALLLNREFRGKSLVRMIIYAPYVFMIPAVGVIWRWLLDSNFGVINYYLQLMRLPAIPWLTSERVVLPSMVVVISWETVGYSLVIFLAGLQEIPLELREAATLEGARAWETFWYITEPFLRPTTFFLAVIGIIGALKTFGQPFMITAGGPLNSSTTIVMSLYYSGFQYFRMGYAPVFRRFFS